MNLTSSPQRLHILIAEDSGVQTLMLKHLLEEQDYLVSTANNGRKALEIATDIRPALVISDVNMPEMSGYELCRHIRASPGLGHTPVILVTSLSDPDDVLLGLECNANSFVIKPYDKQHLLERVKHALHSGPAALEKNSSPVEILFEGRAHSIGASRVQILDLLLATYKAAEQRNKELQESRDLLRQSIAETAAANRFLDSVIENIPDVVFVKDAIDLRYVKINLAGEYLVGFKREDFVGRTDHDFFPGEEVEQFISRDREALRNCGQLHIAEEHVHTAKNGVRLLRTKKLALINEQGIPTHLLGISEDITEKNELEQKVEILNAQLKVRAEDLEAANKSLESFTSAASHDLRSPLSVIGGYAGLLQKNHAKGMNEIGLRYLSVIVSSAKNMATLIDDLLAFSRMGLKHIDKSSVDMKAMAEAVITDIQHFHPEHRKTRISLAPLPPAQVDMALLRQVWVNLLSNAFKYSSRVPCPTIEISGRVEGAEVVYSVRDNGAGFNMDSYDKLFTMFERLHTETDFNGTGVGLAIVHRIVTRHGGRVWAEGKVGHGAVFYFALPV